MTETFGIDPNEHEESKKCSYSEQTEQIEEKIEFKKQGDSRPDQKEVKIEYEKGDSVNGMQSEASCIYPT